MGIQFEWITKASFAKKHFPFPGISSSSNLNGYGKISAGKAILP